MPKLIDLTGQRFGKLVVVKHMGTNAGGFLVRCDCGQTRAIRGANLRRGHYKSCGCLRPSLVAELKTVHGHGRRGQHSAEYEAWAGMIKRCYNPATEKYPRYGGRGIRVCDRWRTSFLAFLEDMGPRPSAEHSVDRKDNDGDYEPGNCRWATRMEQASNTSTNRRLEYGGETHTLSEWARLFGVPMKTLWARLRHLTLADALTTPRYSHRAPQGVQHTDDRST